MGGEIFLMTGLFFFLFVWACLAKKEVERLNDKIKKLKNFEHDFYMYHDQYHTLVNSIDDATYIRDTYARNEKARYEAEIEELKEQLSMQRLEILCHEEDLKENHKLSIVRENATYVRPLSEKTVLRETIRKARDVMKELLHSDE